MPDNEPDLLGHVPGAPRICRIWDCETSGMPENPDAEVIELGRIDLDMQTLEVVNPWRGFIRPHRPIPPETMAVHHITLAEIEAEGPTDEPWRHLWHGCGPDDVVVAHNMAFEKHFHNGNGRRWICTYKCARAFWPDAPSHSNQALRYWLGIDEQEAFDPARAMPPHRALPDAYVTAFLLRELLRVKSIDELVHISMFPALLSKLTFGKHKGMTYAEAPADYLEWIRDKSDMDEDTKFSAKYWLAKRRSAA